MIQTFVDDFMAARSEFEAVLQFSGHPSYTDLVWLVVSLISKNANFREMPDPRRITTIDQGGPNGVLLWIIPDKRDTPSKYWYVRVDYESCSASDTLEGIKSLNSFSKEMTPSQLADYWTLGLHIAQNIKEMK